MSLDKGEKTMLKVILICLAVLILSAGLVFGVQLGYEKITFSHYEDGFKDGTQNTILIINQDIAEQGFVKITAGDQFMILAPVKLE